MKQIKLTNGGFAIVDGADYERLNQWNWRKLHQKGKSAYAMRCEYNSGEVTCYYMHREVIGAVDGEMVDHIDHDGLNNQRENLRLCTQSQNNLNGRKRRGCSSEYKGVTWRKDTKKWQAQAWLDGKRNALGCYDLEADAAQAYNWFIAVYAPEFGVFNSPLAKESNI